MLGSLLLADSLTALRCKVTLEVRSLLPPLIGERCFNNHVIASILPTSALSEHAPESVRDP